MTTPQETVPDSNERRLRAVARLESTGNLDAVARAFKVTPDDLAAWAAEASGGAHRMLDDDKSSSRSLQSDRFARWRRPESPLKLPSLVAIVLGALPLSAWPMAALWAVIGGFIDGRGSFSTAVFGWSLVLYPLGFAVGVLGWVLAKRWRPRVAFVFAILPCLQFLVCTAAFFQGLWEQGSHA